MTKEKFNAYVAVQQSGATNMWAVDYVCQLSSGELEEADCLDIMKNYSKYEKEYSK